MKQYFLYFPVTILPSCATTWCGFTRLTIVSLCLLLCPGIIAAQEEQDIIEYAGDHYTVNVEAMKPDKEMTLMDVLQTCPELMSGNGRRLSENYEIRMDNVVLAMDDETMQEALKADEISTIDIYQHTPVYIGGAGRFGTIDIYLKEQADGTTSGKLLLEGSTRGNGKAYADVVTRTRDVTVRGYALANLHYAKGTLTDDIPYSSRQGIENVHFNIDWNISDNDNLKIKLTQNFLDSKHRIQEEDGTIVMPDMQRYWSGVACYTRTLNDQGATLLSESGIEYLNTAYEEFKYRDCLVYHYTEASIPCLNNDLTILAGWEIDYDNLWAVDYDRQHMMFNDLYLQLDYAKGPWVLTLGDRFRIVNYWHRVYDWDDTSLWNNNRTEHSYLASVGYKTGKHFIQGLFSRDYCTPIIDDLFIGYDENLRRRRYVTDFKTNMVYSTEARYTFQKPDLVVSGSLIHTWENNNLLLDEQYTGVKASATWRIGCLRLTAGADYYHGNVKSHDYDVDKHSNFFHLRLLPTLLLNGGLRISSSLLYNSRQNLLTEMPAHLYASVKVSKDLGRHCTLSADFHDLAGSPRISVLQLGNYYGNRAVTLGCSYRF